MNMTRGHEFVELKGKHQLWCFADPNAKTLHCVYASEYPASRFAYFEDGSFLVSDVMLPSFLSKLRAVWQPKKAGKIECKGQRYEFGDFIIKVGTVSVGPNAKGIVIEVCDSFLIFLIWKMPSECLSWTWCTNSVAVWFCFIKSLQTQV